MLKQTKNVENQCECSYKQRVKWMFIKVCGAWQMVALDNWRVMMDELSTFFNSRES